MSLTILDSSTAAAVAAATNQTDQLAALLAPWAGGNVIARVMSGATLRATSTHGPWVVNGGASPRSATIGALVSSVRAAVGTQDRVVFRAGSTDIFMLTSGVGSGDVPFAFPVNALRRDNLVGLTITAMQWLPLAPPAPAQTITLSALAGLSAVAGGAPLSFSALVANPTALPLGLVLETVSGPTVTPTPSSSTWSLGDLNKAISAAWAAAGTSVIRVRDANNQTSNSLSVTVAPAPPVATALTLSFPSTGDTNTPVAVVVTPDAAIASGGGTATLSASNGGTLGATTLNFTAGSSAPQSTTLNRSADGASVVTMTNNMGLTNAGSGATYTSSTNLLRAPPSGMSNKTLLYGDSLTEDAFRATFWYWANGLLGAPLDIVANSGVSGRSVGDMDNEFNNDYLDPGGHPGASGVSGLGLIILMGGTNGWRGNSPATMDSGTIASINSLIAKAKAKAQYVLWVTMPPIVGGVSSPTYARDVFNNTLRSIVAADTSGRVSLLEPHAGTTNGSGGGLSQMFQPDGCHWAALGTYTTALGSLAPMTAYLANQSFPSAPLITDPAHVYPAFPQWVTNPAMVGSNSVSGGFVGALPNNWAIGAYGAGAHGGVLSIRAADVGDPNQRPWLRIKPNASFNSQAPTFEITAAGRAITNVDPPSFAQMMEVNFVGLQNFERLEFSLQNQFGNRFSIMSYLPLPATGITARTTMRNNFHTAGFAGGGTPRLYAMLWGLNNASGEMGYVEVRCPAIEG